MYSVRDGVLSVLLVVVLLLGATAYFQHQRIQYLSAQAETASATIAALDAKVKGEARLQKERKEKNDAAQEAYRANPVWSSDVVPDDVADLLRDRHTR